MPPKKMIQDIYVVKKSIRMVKRSDVRDGFYAENKKPVDKIKKTDDTININKVAPKNIEENYDNGLEYLEEKKHVTKDSLILLWIICIAAIATLLFFLSSAFATATLDVTPKNQTISLNDSYNISPDKTVSGLHYEVASTTQDLSKSLDTNGQQYSAEKATGKAIIYNSYSSAVQRLIINTRLETKSGLIYRIRNSVDVPGDTTVNGVKTPGSIEVDIIADQAGDTYNTKLSDASGTLTIPGFSGSDKYVAFYAKFSSDIEGGLTGNVKTVASDVLQSGRTDLQNTLKDELVKEAYATQTDEYILFKDDYYTECSDLPDDISASDYKITEECSIYAIMFDKNELSEFIAQNKITGFDNSKVDVLWDDSDIVTISGSTAEPWTENSLSAKFFGPAEVVWQFDPSSILNAIVGQDKSVIDSVMENSTSTLSQIQATIRPMWRSTFPDDANKIKIIDTIRGNAN